MFDPLVREARLRPEAALLYPMLPPNTWLRASEIGAQILAWQLRTTGPVDLGDRLLNEDHFEFRGGGRRGRATALRTRRSDPGAPPQPGPSPAR